MLLKKIKTRCVRKQMSKCKSVCRLYNKIQIAYADVLQDDNEIEEFKCNVLLEGLDIGEYTSVFVCTKTDGTLRVRECVFRKNEA